jgi:Tol biopolymer transport system component
VVIAWTMRWGVLVVTSACSFQLPQEAAVDGGGDASPGNCVEKWLAGPTFVAPAPLSSLNTGGSENDVFVSRDELTIYFARGGDIFVASRLATTDDFAGVNRDATLSSDQVDSKLSLSSDGLTAYVNSNRPAGGDTDVWRGTRAGITGAFTFDQMYLGAVDTTTDEWDPHISADELRLYLAPNNGAAQHVAVATRDSRTASFGAAQIIAELASSTTDNDPTLTADERVIVFASNRSGNRGLWYATRADRAQVFGSPLQLVMINSAASDDGPHLSADGCRLYFSSSRDGANRIYITTR